MNYPFWEIPFLGGGLLIAGIAVVHVFIAHFAIGGGLFLALAERKATRENDAPLKDFLKTHTRFFVLLTLVLGALTGVGIWFTISTVHPAATSALLHVFLWVWATEWTFFFTEIAAILIYHATWEKLDARRHNLIAWIYFVAAYLSLVAINGILSFMLTPGKWLQTRSLADAFFNPTFIPSALMRTGVAVALGGMFALLTGSWQRDEGLRMRVVKYSGAYMNAAIPFLLVGGLWYGASVPALSREIATGYAAAVTIFTTLSVAFAAIIFAFGYLLAYRQPQAFSPGLAGLFLALGFLAMGTGEFVREAIRKPYIIYGYMYSNSVIVDQVPELKLDGYLRGSLWLPEKEVTHTNELAAGEALFRGQCQMCHTVVGYNPIKPLVKGWSEQQIYEALGHLNTLKRFMPPFAGNRKERAALAKWLASLNAHGGPD